MFVSDISSQNNESLGLHVLSTRENTTSLSGTLKVISHDEGLDEEVHNDDDDDDDDDEGHKVVVMRTWS